jgi:hypothetical protein
MDENSTTVMDRRCRAAKPERIDIGTDVLVRDDIFAKEKGVTTRTLGRDDAHGAPFTYHGSIKYRPEKQYHQYMASRIQVRKPPKRRAVT